MNDFNIINNNFYRPIQQAGVVKNDIKENTLQNENINQPQKPVNQNNINPALIYNLENAKMDRELVLKYLQNLLKLPESIDKFLNQLNTKNLNPKALEVLVENMVNTKALSELLNQNSQDAISKLLQTISTSLKSGITDVTQLKEILGILSTIQNSTNINTNTLREFLLLYVPLNAMVFDKNVEFSEVPKEQEEKIKNSTLSIMFQTVNFSNILCALNQDNNNLYLDMYMVDSFPCDKFNKIITTLSKEANFNTLIDFHKIQNETKSKVQNFKVVSQGFIPTDILLLAHLIIKTTFNIDNDFSLT